MSHSQSRLNLRFTPHGVVLCLAGKWRPEFVAVAEAEKITGLELESLNGEHETNLAFLKVLPKLSYFGSLFSFPFDYSPLYDVDSIRSLKFITLRGAAVDFTKFPKLESAVIPWHSLLNSIFKCDQLRSLSLFGYRATDSGALTELKSLETLKLKDCSLRELTVLPSLGRLRRLELGLLPKLQSLTSISQCSHLELLRLSKCGSDTNYHLFRPLRNLTGLLVDTDKEIGDIEFVESLSRLRIFNFALSVRDGRLKRLLKCPVLARAHFADKKHYDIRRDELNDILRATRAPLSDSEETAFRSISSGINDWDTLGAPEREVTKN